MLDDHRDILHLARVGDIIPLLKIVLNFLFRKLFDSKNVLFFIHFNLAVSLLVAILTFVLGIETASGNTVSVL